MEILPSKPNNVFSKEGARLPHDPFLDMLPMLLSDELPDGEEPSFIDLQPETKSRYIELMNQRELLAKNGKFPTGNGVAIFVSEVGTDEEMTYLSGVDKPLVHYSYGISEEERDEHLRAAEGLQHRITQITNGGVETSIQIASKTTMDNAITNPKVAHIILVGHANRSEFAVGIDEDFTWEDPHVPLDHLKLSFGVFGCGIEKEEGPHPRIGQALVAPGGIVYGVGSDFLAEGTPYDFDELVILPGQDLLGTPRRLVDVA